MAVVRGHDGRDPERNTNLALDKSADTTVIRIADDLDVVDLSVRGKMIVESANQLSVIHC